MAEETGKRKYEKPMIVVSSNISDIESVVAEYMKIKANLWSMASNFYYNLDDEKDEICVSHENGGGDVTLETKDGKVITGNIYCYNTYYYCYNKIDPFICVYRTDPDGSIIESGKLGVDKIKSITQITSKGVFDVFSRFKYLIKKNSIERLKKQQTESVNNE